MLILESKPVIILINFIRRSIVIYEDQEEQTHKRTYQQIFAADGGYSCVRRKFLSIPGFEYTQTCSNIGYLELPIKPNAEGDFAFPPKFLVWPGKDFMMNAIPNINKSFTGNIVMAMKGEGYSFENLKGQDKMTAFLKEHFPSVVPYVDLEQIDVSMTEILKDIRCFPWKFGNICLIGDAAHSMYPFYGQGLNCGLEDCHVMFDLIKAYPNNWEKITSEFQTLRKPNSDAISDLS